MAIDEDFEINEGKLEHYNGTEKIIKLPTNVTSIEDNAFCNCKDLSSIIIPESVTTIESCAFANCTNL